MLSKIKIELSKIPLLFWVSLAFIAIIITVRIVEGSAFLDHVENINKFTFHYSGSYYLWYLFIVTLLFCIIGFTPLGKIRFGGQDAKPEHSFFSWFSMIFCAGMGIGLLFWGAAEPLCHFMTPPIDGCTSVPQRQAYAFQIAFLHWSFVPWAIYGLTAMAIAFMGLNLKKGFFFTSILKNSDNETKAKKFFKGFIDFITLIAILFGVSCSFAIAVMSFENGLENVFDITLNNAGRLTIIVVITICYMISSMRGLSKGIRILSNLSMIISFVLLAAIAFFGPQIDFSAIFATVPEFITNFHKLSLGLVDYASSDWLREWTLPLWAWWLAFAPFVGIFVALISKGRTIRELVVASMFGPALFSILWFIIWGGASMALQVNSEYFGPYIVIDNADVVLFKLLGSIWDFPILQWITILLIATFFINSADSAAYTLAAMSNNDIDNEPPKILQLSWGLLFTSLATLFIFTGGYKLLLQFLFVIILPFSIWLIIVFLYTIYKITLHYKKVFPVSVTKSKEKTNNS